MPEFPYFTNNWIPSLTNSPVLIFSTVSHVLWNELISEKDQSLLADKLQMDYNWDNSQRLRLHHGHQDFCSIKMYTMIFKSQAESCFPASIYEINDTELALAADAYLTFIAIIHQVYIQQVFLHFDTHTCSHHHTTKHGQHCSFHSTHYRHLPDMVSKNAPNKNCNRLWPCTLFLLLRTGKGVMVSVSGLLYTFDKDIKAEPVPWIV